MQFTRISYSRRISNKIVDFMYQTRLVWHISKHVSHTHTIQQLTHMQVFDLMQQIRKYFVYYFIIFNVLTFEYLRFSLNHFENGFLSKAAGGRWAYFLFLDFFSSYFSFSWHEKKSLFFIRKMKWNKKRKLKFLFLDRQNDANYFMFIFGLFWICIEI